MIPNSFIYYFLIIKLSDDPGLVFFFFTCWILSYNFKKMDIFIVFCNSFFKDHFFPAIFLSSVKFFHYNWVRY